MNTREFDAILARVRTEWCSLTGDKLTFADGFVILTGEQFDAVWDAMGADLSGSVITFVSSGEPPVGVLERRSLDVRPEPS